MALYISLIPPPSLHCVLSPRLFVPSNSQLLPPGFVGRVGLLYLPFTSPNPLSLSSSLPPHPQRLVQLLNLLIDIFIESRFSLIEYFIHYTCSIR